MLRLQYKDGQLTRKQALYDTLLGGQNATGICPILTLAISALSPYQKMT